MTTLDHGTVKTVVWAGPYTSGEIPLPFTFKFDDSDIDFSLSAFVLGATLLNDDGSEMSFSGSVTWSDNTIGLVEVQLAENDVVVPAGKLVITRRLQVWTGDGTNRIASVEIKYNCHPSIGTPPAI